MYYDSELKNYEHMFAKYIRDEKMLKFMAALDCMFEEDSYWHEEYFGQIIQRICGSIWRNKRAVGYKADTLVKYFYDKLKQDGKHYSDDVVFYICYGASFLALKYKMPEIAEELFKMGSKAADNRIKYGSLHKYVDKVEWLVMFNRIDEAKALVSKMEIKYEVLSSEDKSFYYENPVKYAREIISDKYYTPPELSFD